MSNIQKLLDERKIPDVLIMNDGTPVTTAEQFELRKEEIRELLQREVYGFLPKAPAKVEYADMGGDITFYNWAGKADHLRYNLFFETGNGRFSFPFYYIIPKAVKNPKVVVYISFDEKVPNKYLPVEEIIDQGFAIAHMYYNDITVDIEDDFSSGLSPLFLKPDRGPEEPGKIALWAYAASRVLDFLIEDARCDTANSAICGHSRLGKTALLAGMMDERFKFVLANHSGCSGDAITRGKGGEQIKNILQRFPFWFCKNYAKYIDNHDALPFDQHFLLAAIAPRYLCTGGALQDTWADPFSQYLSACTLNRVYALYGKKGLVHPDRLPEPGETFHEGDVGFHLRDGEHFLSRYDWNKYLSFINKKA
jgi:hypothetical protein